MALRTLKCTRCTEEFKAGNWYCADGEAHTVEQNDYFITDAPAEANDRIHSRTMMCNVIPERREQNGAGDVHIVPGVNIEFVRGKFTTTDPQLQIRLDERKGVFSGDEGRKRWEDNYFTHEEKRERKLMEQAAAYTRLQQEHNKLLEQVKSQKRQPTGV